MTISRKIVISSLAVASVMDSCQSFEEINAPKEEMTKEQLRGDNYNIASSFPKVTGLIIPANSSGFFQHIESLTGEVWARYMMTNPAKFNNNFSGYRYMHDGWVNIPFNILTDFYPEFRAIKEKTGGKGVNYAWAQIIRVSLMHRMTDMFGPIPYTKIEGGNLQVPYDSQEVVYKALLADLDGAIAELMAYVQVNPGQKPMAEHDYVYQGDFTKWIRYANSLKLRIAMRMRYADPSAAQKAAEEAVNNSVGVIVENADNAYFRQKGQSMLWLINHRWGDARVSADITSYMNGYEDPRRSSYFTVSGFDGAGYQGIRNGSTQDLAEFSKYSDVKVDQSDPTILFTASEVAFLKAEGALIGWNMGGASAKELYEQGIALSFSQWGAGSSASYIESIKKPGAYTDPSGKYSFSAVSQIVPKWDESAMQEENLERIITQKWIALWPNGIEAWSEYRRTGYPRFFPLVGNVETAYANMPVANRFLFSRTEYDVNKNNMQAAITLLGGPDNFATKMWWQKKK